jgi:hypothetical protein
MAFTALPADIASEKAAALTWSGISMIKMAS